MGFFSRKKKKIQERPAAPPFQQQPAFPDLERPPVEYQPDEDEHRLPPIDPQQPAQRPPQTGLMDREAPKEPLHQTVNDIPTREPGLMQRRYPQREALAKFPEDETGFDERRVSDPAAEALQQRRRQPVQPMQRPVPPMHQSTPPQGPPVTHQGPPQTQGMQQSIAEDKPIFVKIGQYREAQTNIQALKQKIQEIENLLAQLEQIRNQEQSELNQAKQSLNQVKAQLLSIDKNLFEV